MAASEPSEMTNDKENDVDKGNDDKHPKTSAVIPRKQKFKTVNTMFDAKNLRGRSTSRRFYF